MTPAEQYFFTSLCSEIMDVFDRKIYKKTDRKTSEAINFEFKIITNYRESNADTLKMETQWRGDK